MPPAACRRVIPALIVSALGALPAAGQPVEPAEPAPAIDPAAEPVEDSATVGDLDIQLRASGRITLDAELEDSEGEVSIARADAGVKLSTTVGDRSRLSFDVAAERSWYDFDGASGLVVGTSTPFSDGTIFTFRPSISVQQTDNWSWFVGGQVQLSYEDGADVGDAATFGGFGGVRYRINENLTIQIGVGARSRLEDDPLVVPLIGVEWKVSDRVTLATDGLGARLTAQIRDNLALFVRGGWELREFRMDDDGPLPDGVMRDSRVPVAVGLEWSPAPRARLAVFGGAVVWQEYRFDDSGGDEVADENTDPAAFFGLSGEITF